MLERDELRRIAQQQQEKMDELLHEREHVQSLANAVNELRYHYITPFNRSFVRSFRCIHSLIGYDDAYVCIFVIIVRRINDCLV